MEGDCFVLCGKWSFDISIHSLRMEGDMYLRSNSSSSAEFQSTPSAWRETLFLHSCFHFSFHFNPLPPHGGRPTSLAVPSALTVFQSTPSTRRETSRYARMTARLTFQSTPSTRRETYVPGISSEAVHHFNPLPPHGGRQHYRVTVDSLLYISIHSLRMEGDKQSGARLRHVKIFQSTPSAWRET